MKRNIEKLLALTLILMMVVPAVLKAQTGKTNFSGDWTLNAEKSTQPQGGNGGGARMGGGNFVATQDGNVLTVVRSRTGQDGTPTTTTMKYTLDGKESINTSPRGDSKSIAKWSADGKSLTIETTRTMDMNGESRTMKSSEVWSLTDAKTLSVNTTREGMNGEVKSTMIYEKK
jgi:dipeptidyl aminopeptidase/acylaminoacyl peptidase